MEPLKTRVDNLRGQTRASFNFKCPECYCKDIEIKPINIGYKPIELEFIENKKPLSKFFKPLEELPTYMEAIEKANDCLVICEKCGYHTVVGSQMDKTKISRYVRQKLAKKYCDGDKKWSLIS